VILAAGLLVLLGLGLFVGALLTGTTAFYWGCVAVCVVAAVLLYLARRRISEAEAEVSAPTAPPPDRATGATATGRAPTAVAPEPPTAGTVEEAAPREPAHSAPPSTGPVATPVGDPPIEDVEVTDLLMVVDLRDEVLVVDEHPRYHLAGCPHLRGRTTIPLPLDEARTDGFTPCATCAPDRNLAERERARRHAGGN